MDAARLRPLGVGEVLDAAIKIYRARFGTLVKAVAVVVVPVAILTALVQLSAAPDESSRTDVFPTQSEDPFAPGDPLSDLPDGGDLAARAAGFLVVGFLGWVAATLATAASFEIVSGAYVDRHPTWQESLRAALRRLRSLLWLQVLYGVLLLLGTLAFIVPGVYLYVAWAVAVPALLFEDRTGMSALRRSRELLRGRWWQAAAVLLLVLLLNGILQAAISGVLFGVLATVEGDLAFFIAQAVSGSVGSLLTTPFAAAVTTVLFFDALVRKEGFDLAQMATTMGVEPPPEVEEPPATDAGRSDEPPFWPPPPGWRPGA